MGAYLHNNPSYTSFYKTHIPQANQFAQPHHITQPYHIIQPHQKIQPQHPTTPRHTTTLQPKPQPRFFTPTTPQSYKGHVPNMKFEYGSTFGNLTASYLRRTRNKHLTSSTTNLNKGLCLQLHEGFLGRISNWGACLHLSTP